MIGIVAEFAAVEDVAAGTGQVLDVLKRALAGLVLSQAKE